VVNNSYPILNGVAVSWADVTIRVVIAEGQLVEIKDIASFNTSRTVEVGEQRGASGGRVMRRTTGSVSYECSGSLYRSGYQQLMRALTAAAEAQGLIRGNQRMISLVHFDVDIQHTPFNDVEVYQRLCRGCRFLGDALNGAEGTDADQVELTLSALEIVDMIDGKEVVCL